MGVISWLAACETVRAALFVVIFSFLSFTDGRRGEGAGVVVGPRALIVFSGFVASIWAVLLTGVSVTFPGSLMTYKVISLCDLSPTHWGMCVIAVVGHGARILRPARKTVHVASRSIVAALCLAASCFLCALTWASCWRGLVGARMNEFDAFLGKGDVLLP